MTKLNIFIIVIFSIILFTSCDGPFIAEEKSGVPKDHTSNENGFMHKSGAERPFEYDSQTGTMNCANSDCHGEYLRGGIAIAEDKNNFAPSCYQCHENKWSELSDFNKLEIQK